MLSFREVSVTSEEDVEKQSIIEDNLTICRHLIINELLPKTASLTPDRLEDILKAEEHKSPEFNCISE